MFPIKNLDLKLEQELEPKLAPEPKSKYWKFSWKSRDEFLNEVVSKEKTWMNKYLEISKTLILEIVEHLILIDYCSSIHIK